MKEEIWGKVNFYAVLNRDANYLIEMSKKGDDFTKTIFARHSIYAFIFSLEAGINLLIDKYWDNSLKHDFGVKLKEGEQITKEKILFRASLKEKWKHAPKLFSKNSTLTRKKFWDKFTEICRLRDSLVHAKKDTFETKSILTGEGDKKQVDDSVTPKYEKTQLPKDPNHWTVEHSIELKTLTEKMFESLKEFTNDDLKLLVTDEINTSSGYTLTVERGRLK